jgi:ubiquinone/menaquinone biosynthesis C-methylase UbiE
VVKSIISEKIRFNCIPVQPTVGILTLFPPTKGLLLSNTPPTKISDQSEIEVRDSKLDVTVPPSRLRALQIEGATKSDRVLYRAYKNAEAHVDDMYSVYEELYDLPTLEFEETITDRALFDYCLDRRHFLLILPYTTRGAILLTPVFNSNSLVWRIVGGGVRASFTENFVGACQRHISKFFEGVILGEIEPVAFLKNRFKYGDEIHEHRGVAFIARVRNENQQSVLDQMPHSRGHFVSIHTQQLDLAYMDHQKILGHAIEKIKSANAYSNQELEVLTNARYRYRYKFHDVFIKPTVRFLSNFFYRYSIQDLENTIKELVLSTEPQSVLDVACGDNLSIVRFSTVDDVPLVVGNDISWSQIELMSGRLEPDRFRNTRSFTLFTNHDARRLPFRDQAFDFVICKNVLHHMPDQESVMGLLAEVQRVGRRALVIEVLDPKYDGRYWKLRDRYYRKFLKDVGGHLLSREEFKALTVSDSRMKIFEMETLRGIYQLACFGFSPPNGMPKKIS